MNAVAVLAVCGPTASGKSEAAARAALAVGGEIINADSRQVYRDTSIGSGWPAPEIMAMVPHHGYGAVSPQERYNAGRFVSDATRTAVEVRARGNIPILVGGTGLYVEALGGTMPLDRAIASEDIKRRVNAESLIHPQDTLHAWLAVLSRVAGLRVPTGDRYRTMRALESVLALRSGDNGFDRPATQVRLTTLVLQVERQTLFERIRKRTQAMFAQGLADEAVALLRRYGDTPALTGLGYAEALAVHAGLATRDEALRCTVVRTRQYAKRQTTWFRRMRDARVIDANNADTVADAIARAAREMALTT